MGTATNRRNGEELREKYAGAVSKPFQDTSLPAEFIKVGKEIEDAIGRTSFIDDRQHNAFVALYTWAQEFECQEALDTLLMWLNGRPAIGGFNRIQAIMAHTGVIFPEACGVRLSKDSQRFIREQMDAQRHKGQMPEEGDGHHNE